MAESLELRAHAKVNLVLEVTGTRDDGYHEIDTILQTISLHDTVTLRPDGGGALTVAGVHASGVPTDAANLALRARDALGLVTGRFFERVAIHIEKRIPAAGGLGGGSADAAAVLRGLQRLYPEILEAELLAAAAAIGSDEPALVLGGTVRARGRGERVESLPPLPEHGVLLFLPGETIPEKTARMFRALDVLPWDSGSVAGAWPATARNEFRAADVYNSFERVAFDLFPGLSVLWERLEAKLQQPVRLAGAGPTLFWVGRAQETRSIAERCLGLPCEVVQAVTVGSPWTR